MQQNILTSVHISPNSPYNRFEFPAVVTCFQPLILQPPITNKKPLHVLYPYPNFLIPTEYFMTLSAAVFLTYGSHNIWKWKCWCMMIMFCSFIKSIFQSHIHLNHGHPTFLWQRAIPIIMSWFVGRTWWGKKMSGIHKCLKYCVIFIIYK
jgi:hypothetical protein